MTFNEPLSFPGMYQLVEGFVHAVSYVAFPALVLALVYVGFMYVSAQGNARTIQNTHGQFMKVAVAVIVVSGLWVIFTIGNTFIRYLVS